MSRRPKIRSAEEWMRQHAVMAADKKDQHIAELEHALPQVLASLEKQVQRIKAMAALLDRVPHMNPERMSCGSGCPACAWAKMKEGK